ncbi:fumarylacetoacetate hydrolase family protein [Nonomuraea basaltis]|nr:fumarylacetoacetate hydrolase family protein [Nonomuraea basaltis]
MLNHYGLDRLTEDVDRLWTGAGVLLDESSVVFEPPVATCTKICCLALNYAEHAAESGLEVPPEPVLFFKPPSALTGHRRPVVAPARTRHLEHEVELAVVIGSVTRDLPAERWREAVAGYTVINDLTARDLQLANIARNVPWDQSKGFDTFAPAGPYLATVDEVPDPQGLELTLEVRGQIRQRANTKQMVFGIPRLIADLSDGMTLLPGDLIATGTIAGIAPLQDGDVMRATVGGVGTLVNRVHFGPPKP